MPIPTFPLSDRTTQVREDEIIIYTQSIRGQNRPCAFFKVSFISPLYIGQLLNISPVTDWANRCKQIMKVWRKVSAADKVPYLVSSVLIAFS